MLDLPGHARALLRRPTRTWVAQACLRAKVVQELGGKGFFVGGWCAVGAVYAAGDAG